MPTREHDIAILIEGKRLREPVSYSIDVDMLQPADAFSVTLSLDRETWDQAVLDGQVTIAIDDVPCLSGFVDTVTDNGNGSMTIAGRDRAGRLVDESIPGANYQVGSLRLSDVILDLVSPWYTAISFSNAEDRRLRTGSGKKASSGREPSITFAQQRAIGRVIDAGTSRWEAVERVLRPLGLLAWGSADGRTLVIAQPNYSQAVQYEFFETLESSNVTRMTLSKSNANRYAQLIVSGSGRGLYVPLPPFVPSFPGEQRPKQVSSNRLGIALDNPDSDDGTGLDFKYPKRLFVVSEALNQNEAQVEASRALARARVNARTVDITVPGHGQLLDTAREVTLFAPDTVARIFKEIERAPDDDSAELLFDEDMYVTRVTYRGSNQECTTDLSLVPLNTLLV